MKTQLVLLVFAAGVIGCGSNHKGVIEASGTLEATDVKVSAKVPGQIETIRIQEGSQVQVGDTLIILDRSTLELQFKQAQSGFDVVDAQYRLLLNGARSEDLRLAEEALHQAEASFKNANDDYGRMKELLASNTITRKQFDDAESRYTIAKAQLSSAEQGVSKLRNFARPEDLAAARARVSQAKASSDLLKKQLADAVVVAPVSGTVTHIPVEQGELVGMGSIVASISRLDNMNLMIYVNETELGKAKIGGMADVFIDTYPDRAFPAKVVYISPIAEFTPKNVQTKEDRTKLVFGVKLEIDNKDGVLKSGMPADAYVR
jgi:HlyD family secretion protein